MIINGSFNATEGKFNITFGKAKTKFCLRLHYNSDVNCLLMEKKLMGLKWILKMCTFLFDFSQEAYMNNLTTMNLKKY